MKNEGINFFLVPISAFWSASSGPRSSRWAPEGREVFHEVVVIDRFHCNVCQPPNIFTLAPEIHGWRCAISPDGRVILVSKAWALSRFIYCFIDTVCFTYICFVSNDEIKTELYQINHYGYYDNTSCKTVLFRLLVHAELQRRFM